MALRALDAAKSAGAHFASARLTRTTSHVYSGPTGFVQMATEFVGMGVQALVDGYWGFASSPYWDPAEAVRLARAAVAQARTNARANTDRLVARRHAIELGRVPAVAGAWQTPVQVNPFNVPIEDKADFYRYWQRCARRVGLQLANSSNLRFAREERVVTTTDGCRVTQTRLESGGTLLVSQPGDPLTLPVPGLNDVGGGWELFRDGNVPGRIAAMVEHLAEERRLTAASRPVTVGQYTLVCDGATMAALLDATLGVATQLDRALGYEANARGTSYLNDPLAMLGSYPVAAPMVTVTADRSMPGGLATVKWDDEGVEPDTATLVKDGVLTDFQTTRESANWLGEYYTKVGRPVRSHGCAASESALVPVLQHAPNLALEPTAGGATLEKLVESIPDGILVTGGRAWADFQGHTGLLVGTLRQVKNGRFGPHLKSGAVLFNSSQLWKSIKAVGGGATRQAVPVTQYGPMGLWGMREDDGKGEPTQAASRTVTAAAAILTNQAVIDPARKA